MQIDWNQYENFSEHEFRCSHTGLALMEPDFLDRLQLDTLNTSPRPNIWSD